MNTTEPRFGWQKYTRKRGLLALCISMLGEIADPCWDRDDLNKCQNVVDKYQAHVRNHGSKSQQRQALEMLLPSSPLYDFLEGGLPYPPATYAQIAQIVEAEESERINKEIGKRRTRLGARIDQVRREVRQETLTQSPLEDIYQQIINWTRDDEERRHYEEKLLQHAYETMLVLAAEAKAEKRAQVKQMAQGMVILKHPYKLAWTIAIEWNDGESLADWDEAVLRDYMELFPEDGLAKVLRGYIGSEISPISPPADRNEMANSTDSADPSHDAQESPKLTPEERLVLMTVSTNQFDNKGIAEV